MQTHSARLVGQVREPAHRTDWSVVRGLVNDSNNLVYVPQCKIHHSGGPLNTPLDKGVSSSAMKKSEEETMSRLSFTIW